MRDLPLWLAAGALTLIASMFAISILAFITWHLIIVPVQKEQRRQEQIRREPWRAFE